MPGSFDDYAPVEQMAAIGRALASIGWSPRRPRCGCSRCEAAAAPPHVPDEDEGPPPAIGAFDDDPGFV